jgi:hypothetical protein
MVSSNRRMVFGTSDRIVIANGGWRPARSACATACRLTRPPPARARAIAVQIGMPHAMVRCPGPIRCSWTIPRSATTEQFRGSGAGNGRAGQLGYFLQFNVNFRLDHVLRKQQTVRQRRRHRTDARRRHLDRFRSTINNRTGVPSSECPAAPPDATRGRQCHGSVIALDGVPLGAAGHRSMIPFDGVGWGAAGWTAASPRRPRTTISVVP